MTPIEIQDEFHKGKANNLGFCARFVISKFITDEKQGKNPIVTHISIDEDDAASALTRNVKEQWIKLFLKRKEL